MRIVAVIPARAGSKGIPNKNIRLLNGLPLVSYSIKNALLSKRITDVIVSTDSEEVKIVAMQLGAKVRWRHPSLCSDDVTLDGVIYDAIANIRNPRIDYVVTMQPTSPTLKVETIDSAIDFIIKNDLDTVISVVNKPHLSWKAVDGRIVPDYSKRLNRQFLPAHYQETGGFLISKRKCVSKTSRIGQRVSVYPLSDQEGVDIDDFNDWMIAERYLKEEKIGIYVNGNNKMGLGHIYRSLELADEFQSKPDILFDKNQTDISVFGNTTHSLVPIDGLSDLLDRCRKRHYTLFINDILTTSVEYMDALRAQLPPSSKIVNFEDAGDGRAKADAVFNALLSHDNLPNVFSGEQFYISGKLFTYYHPVPIRKKATKVLITFGGADPQNYSFRLLQIASKKKYDGYRFVVVLGRANKNASDLVDYAASFPNVKVLRDVSNMAEVMSACDFAFTSRGRTCYELAMLGVPSIAMAQNDREEQHGFANSENGFLYLGLNPSDEIIEAALDMYLRLSKDARCELQQRMLKHDLKNGRSRVMGIIKAL